VTESSLDISPFALNVLPFTFFHIEPFDISINLLVFASPSEDVEIFIVDNETMVCSFQLESCIIFYELPCEGFDVKNEQIITILHIFQDVPSKEYYFWVLFNVKKYTFRATPRDWYLSLCFYQPYTEIEDKNLINIVISVALAVYSTKQVNIIIMLNRCVSSPRRKPSILVFLF